ncbi:MAG: SRPBCC family protein [Actinomycetota bacterium]
MTRIRETMNVDAPPEEVWGIISDVRNLPHWNKHILAVHDVPEGELATGSRYWTEMGGFGVRFRVRAEVMEVKPPRYARVRLSGPLDAIVQTWVHPSGRERSMLEHQVDYSLRGGVLGRGIARLLKRLGASGLLHRGMLAQKREAETG